MNGGLAGLVYRTTMSSVATAAGVVSRLPAAPGAWRGLRDRLGELSTGDRAVAIGATAFWVHAASVGELTAVRPLLVQLRSRYPGRSLLVSTLTRTGLDLARTIPEVHLARLLPLDAPNVVARTLRQVRLEAFFFTETEIWPVWLAALARERVPTFMVSGRVSTRTAWRAGLVRSMFRAALAEVDCCMQSAEDAQRILALGADPLHVHVAGSLKFDAAAATPAGVERLRALVGDARRRLIVGGSTHEGEEAALLDAYDRLARGHRDVALLLAPRHPERLPAVADLVTRRGFTLVRYGEIAGGAVARLPDGPLVLLLDEVGPLASCYELATIAFVGGSLVPVGGHNVLEPARAGRPVVVGPHTANAREVVARLVEARGALRVESTEALTWTLDHLLAHPDEATVMGRRAAALAQSGQGAVDRHMKIIAARLGSAAFAREGAG